MDYNEVKKRDAIREIQENHDPAWQTYDQVKRDECVDKMESTKWVTSRL